jgi:hypothetical protein
VVRFCKWVGIALFLLVMPVMVFNTVFMLGDPEGFAVFQQRQAEARLERQAAWAEAKAKQALVVAAKPATDEPKRLSRRVAAEMCSAMAQQNMKDPDSYVEISKGVNRSDDAQVLVNYRAQNSFGAMMSGQAACDIYTSGDVKLVRVN